MKKKYSIGFWWHSDLRTDITVEAANAVYAIIMAENELSIENWCDGGAGFRIDVRQVS